MTCGRARQCDSYNTTQSTWTATREHSLHREEPMLRELRFPVGKPRKQTRQLVTFVRAIPGSVDLAGDIATSEAMEQIWMPNTTPEIQRDCEMVTSSLEEKMACERCAPQFLRSVSRVPGGVPVPGAR